MPSPSIPLGFNVCSFVFSVTGSTRTPTVTCAAANGVYPDAASMLAEWSDNFTTTGAPFVAGNIAVGYTLALRRVITNIGGNLFTAENTAPIVGTGVSNPPPMNTAVLVNKVTGLAGRKYRGRFFSPPFFAEGSVDAAGQISAGQITASQALWTAAYNGMSSGALFPVLLHDDGTTPTGITAFTVSARIGTIGRRMRR